MTFAIKIDTNGRLVLPKAIRQRLNLTGGTSLRGEVVAGHIELTPATTGRPAIVKKSGMAVLKRTGIKADAAKALATEREVVERRAVRQ